VTLELFRWNHCSSRYDTPDPSVFSTAFCISLKDCAHGGCPLHDTADKTWRHLDFFQHKALLHARLPRVRCPEHGVRQVSVPWARPGSGFTLLFEALVCSFAAMPMAKVAAMTREHDTRIWRIVEHHVGAARDQEDFTGVRKVGMDETSARKGQDYVSIFADMVAGRVLFATEGRDAATVARFAADLAEHGGDPASVTDTSSDMSTAFLSGIRAHLPNGAPPRFRIGDPIRSLPEWRTMNAGETSEIQP
jgi:transposase